MARQRALQRVLPRRQRRPPRREPPDRLDGHRRGADLAGARRDAADAGRADERRGHGSPGMTLRLGPQACGTLEEAALREWLVADGVGGYAMGTVAGLRTRRYHGLLAVAVDGPGARMLGLASLDPVLFIGQRMIRLGGHEWQDGSVAPDGFNHLDSFELRDGVPRWRWAVDNVIVEAELAMSHGRPLVGVHYRIVRAPAPVRLEIEALCTWRDGPSERLAGRDPAAQRTKQGVT